MLNARTASRALELAGASSLSMKPSLPCLIAAAQAQPVLFLGLEGPIHSFVRFKSFTVDARSSASLWSLLSSSSSRRGGGNDGYSNRQQQGAAAGAEWGVLASSSSRLAKDLYRHCFGVIYGADSSFEIVASSAKPASK